MIVTTQFNPFQVNTYLVISDGEVMIVDPGMLLPEEAQSLFEYIKNHSLSVTQIVNTHLHLDHIFGNQAAAEEYGLTPKAHSADFPLGHSLPDQARSFGLPADMLRQPEKFDELADGEVLTVGSLKIRVIAVPGHSPGGIALYCELENWVITGDSLFQSSIGRTDLPGGNHQQLVSSVRSRLLSLPPQTKVYPGHGPSTTIAAELNNPYL
ncbi:MAG: MBL fold metallo-hydrolase [Muribaculaceae bacterium]|nr:MBL fold metallo-hydrolase [Muribaculaceae bacterium]